MNTNKNLATLNKMIKIKTFGPLKKFEWAYKYLKIKGVDIAKITPINYIIWEKTIYSCQNQKSIAV